LADVDGDGIPDGCDTLIDSDGDGLSDSDDQCPDTVSGATINASGCSDAEGDSIDVRDDPISNTSAGNGLLWGGLIGLGLLVAVIVGVLLVRKSRNSDFDDDEDDDYLDEEYATHAMPAQRTTSMIPQRQSGPDPNWQGVLGDDGYEWIEHPQGSDEWYWRDTDTGQWVKH